MILKLFFWKMSANLPGTRWKIKTGSCCNFCANESGGKRICYEESGKENFQVSFGFYPIIDFKLIMDNEHRSSRGNYLRHTVSNSLINFYLTVLYLFVIFSTSSANIMGEHCDWSGNGLSLSPSQGRGVTPVYLRCAQGHITWTYPRGALRVLLRLPNSEKEFRGCIRVTPEFAGARLFLEGQRSLSPLFSLDDGAHKQLIRCFQSKKGQAAIYVEAAYESGEFRREVAGFSYDLHPVPRGSLVSDLMNEECRPCSRREMAHAFCTNDLVVRGLIYGIDVRHELETAEINVKITKVLRHSTDDLYGSLIAGFSSSPEKVQVSTAPSTATATTTSRTTTNGGEEDNEIATAGESRKFQESDIVKLVMPKRCNPHRGPGEFVFMGRKRLGDLSLVCATSLSEWAETVRTLNSDGTSHCVLKS